MYGLQGHEQCDKQLLGENEIQEQPCAYLVVETGAYAMQCGYKGKYRHQSYGTDLQEIEIPVILIMYRLEEDEFPEMSDEPAEVFRIKEISGHEPVRENQARHGRPERTPCQRTEVDCGVPKIKRGEKKQLREKQTADAETEKRVKDRAYGFRALIGFEQQIIGRQHEARYD